MFITTGRYKELMTMIDCQKQIIEEYKKKNDMLIQRDELKSRLISQLENMLKNNVKETIK